MLWNNDWRWAATNPVGPGLDALLIVLAFDFAGEVLGSLRWLIGPGILLAVPELFYLGLVYSPAMIAFCLAVGAHIVVRGSDRREIRVDHAFGVSEKLAVVTMIRPIRMPLS